MNSDQVFDQIEKIANTSGYAKRSLLRPEMKPFLEAAYNPYKKYFIRKNERNIKTKGTEQFSNKTWLLLNDLQKRIISGYNAAAMVNYHIQDLTEKSARLLVRILNKDLRMGMGVKSINAVFPGLIPEHKIMLAKQIEWHRIKYPCFVSFKIDGVRALYRDGVFYSRNGKPYVGLDHLVEELQIAGLYDTVLDGELYIPHLTFQKSSGSIRSLNPSPDAVFAIFELPEIKIPFYERAIFMEDLENISEHVTAVRQQIVNNKEEVLTAYKTARKLGYEGLIIRPYDYKYVGYRSYNWMKLKPKLSDIEVRVINVFEGNGKYINKLGGVVVNYKGEKVRVGSGFTDQERVFYWNNQERIVGHLIEIEAMEETDDGSLRHPVFKRIRDDKED